MRKTSTCLSTALLLLSVSVGILAAEPAKPAPVQTRLKRVALFKNGLGFFVREGTLPSDANIALLGPFAPPAHGTFWVSCPARAGLLGVTARDVTATEMVPAREITELLRANVGAKVTLYTGAEPESAVSGKIIAFAPDRVPAPPDPYAMGQPSDTSYVLPPGRGQFLLLQTDDGIRALDPYRVLSVRFEEEEVEQSFMRDVNQVELEASFAMARRNDWLSVSYLAKGITWAPSYLVDITDPKTARLSAKALIINEAEGLEATHIDLVTGFPNLQFADVLSPVGRNENLAAFFRALSQGRSETQGATVMSNVMMQRAESGRGGGGPGWRASCHCRLRHRGRRPGRRGPLSLSARQRHPRQGRDRLLPPLHRIHPLHRVLPLGDPRLHQRGRPLRPAAARGARQARGSLA